MDSRHTLVQDVIDELTDRLATAGVDAVATSLFTSTPVADGSLLLLDRERADLAAPEESGRPSVYRTLALDLAALVPVDAQAGDQEAARAAALDDAEGLLWAGLDALRVRSSTYSAARLGTIRYRLRRPDHRTVCGVASAQLTVRVKHVNP